MTRRQFERRFRWWTRQLRELGLEHWDLHFEYPQDDEDVSDGNGRGAEATVDVSMHYDTAFVTVAPSTLAKDQANIDRVIVHELLHVLLRDYDRVHYAMLNVIGGQQADVFERQLEHEREGVIERLARAIVLFDVTLQLESAKLADS